MVMTDPAWSAWVANQPVLVAALLLAIGALVRAVVVLYRRNEARAEETMKLVREVMQVTAQNTDAMKAHTAAVERLTDALRSRR
jgi:flagellar biosynthesis/type III secretory pathway M-ring protein FliF/YscJ